ncbi:S10 family serine carboxypeptidase-like protein [Sorangium sp. So ce124]|uniref:S10 family serine carboxypeptidase-like protein n=1 Tax=Sorangium sp. So ce124 TaxID=3133280 RepID=UPI003F614979
MTSLRAGLGGVTMVVTLLVVGCGGSGSDPGGNGGSGGNGSQGGSTSNSGSGGEGPMAELSAEAGFIEIPGSPTLGLNWPARMFYSFQPAQEHPDEAPLILFFNGGPGAATTSVLLPYGTGPFTLDPDAPADTAPRANAASFTRFANLLYVDPRSAGFSYELATVDPASDCYRDVPLYVADAADFVYVLLEFLEAHEPLRDNPVVIAGESYGGTRATMMLYMMQNYARDSDSLELMDRPPSWLKDKMQAHLDAAFPARAGAAREPVQVAEQFGWQLLIQPSLYGAEQRMYEAPLARQDPDFAEYFVNPEVWDGYDVRRTSEEGALIKEHAYHAMRTPEHLETLLGVDLTEVAGLAPPGREPSFRYFERDDPAEIAASESSLRAELGELDDTDAYWLPSTRPCGSYAGDYRTLSAFTSLLERTATFITNARYDAVVYTEALPVFLSEYSTFTVDVDRSLPAGAARPGVVRLTTDTTERSFRFPAYESGHKVSVDAPRELAEDVEAWLAETGATAAR